MTTLLRIDASARHDGSYSRQLGDRFVSAWRAKATDTSVITRDIISEPIPHIANETISGYYTPQENMTKDLLAATALSDTLIGELKAADILLITTPMYNFSVPSALKAWIDHIVRINHTFAYDGHSFTGLITGKPAYVICAYGASGYTNSGPMSAYDLLQGYLGLLLGFLGFTEVHFISVEATTADASVVADHLARALGDVDAALEAMQ
jgi:FMN-dependent NADH-azoreductase